MEKYGDITIHTNGYSALSTASKALYTIGDTRQMFSKPAKEPQQLECSKKDVKVVPWGENNALPQDVIAKVGKSTDMSANLQFNILSTFGEGIKPVFPLVSESTKNYYEYEIWSELMLAKIDAAGDSLKSKLQQQYDEVSKAWEEISTFFEENDTHKYLLEQCTDMHFFYNTFPCIVSNGEKGEKRRFVEIQSLEAAFSRWSEMDKNGVVKWHLYSSKWGEKTPEEKEGELVVTPVLDFRNPVRDLKQRIEDDKSKSGEQRDNTFVVQLTMPTPGRSYYPKPYWYSIIESGIYDFAVAIPEIKKALLENKAVVNYVINISPKYFQKIFVEEKIKLEKKQRDRVAEEYRKMDKFLLEKENKGKSFTTLTDIDSEGKPYPLVEFIALDNKTDGGDFVADSELSSTLISFAMLNNPSLIGAAPGKNKNISGSEARELFIIKQAMLSPFRKMLLKPFYIIKAANNWPKSMAFSIPYIELTTLDNNKTGSVTNTEEQ